MRIKPWTFDFLLRSADGAPDGLPTAQSAPAAAPAAAPAPAASNEPALVAAAASDPAKPADAPPPSEKPQEAAAEFKLPDNFPKELAGKDAAETLTKVQEHLAKLPKPPEKPADYKFEPSDAFKQRYGDVKDDKVLALWNEVAHEIGLDTAAYNKGVNLLFGKMAEAGMIDDPVNVEVELGKLAPQVGDQTQKLSAAKARVNDAVAWVRGLAARGDVSTAEAAKLTGIAMDAVGVQLIEKLRKLGGEHGLQPGGSAAAPPADVMKSFYPTMYQN